MKQALLTELSFFLNLKAKASSKTPTISSIYFGGGTPSLAEVSTIGDVIAHLKNNYPLTPNIEITLEANPTSIEMSKLKDFKSVGVNRISLGVQALNDGDLVFLGRRHSLAQAIDTIHLSKSLFGRVSFDLLYGRSSAHQPHQWREELKHALSLDTGHLSLYNLTVEPGTPLNEKVRKGKVVMPDEDLQTELYEATVEVMEEHGYKQYEISNFALPGFESKHNINYWKGGDYIGVGPGAAGRITVMENGLFIKRSFLQERHPPRWMDTVLREGVATQEDTTLTTKQQLTELIMSGLRTDEGIHFTENFGVLSNGLQLDEIFDVGYINKYKQFLHFSPEGLKATSQGRLILDTILSEILL
uniref:Radical S-adenosyl methionine domain-containing protein 1, mitochondrial n=1 Tax=Arcella intermedia TaxID=1963864 RepID=A0A6B2L6Z9_9EUKA|eukprot:TRINITY_DN2733_c0_g2_i1.p1 TRINITY_DN2733_c0_g2~~TRINITY_DN2733_c0_g2_i1.p1  ORF type:complete len:359 (+),score=95.31 TRINITY_DN2733_c0_g2_i1:196-1272(+)